MIICSHYSPNIRVFHYSLRNTKEPYRKFFKEVSGYFVAQINFLLTVYTMSTHERQAGSYET